TSLTQAVADELRIPIASVRLVMGDTALTPYDAGTFGSRTTPSMAVQLRKAAAAARERLLDLAAAQTKADRAGLVLANGTVTDRRSETSYAFGTLTRGRKLMEVIGEEAVTTRPDQWTVGGQAVPKVDGRAFVTGGH